MPARQTRQSEDVAGTVIAIEGRAALLRGPSGSGKSDLAFRLVKQEAALLVGDDHIDLGLEGGQLIASPKPGWMGKLELRGLGIITLPALDRAPLCLVIDLVPRKAVPRLPEPVFETLCGIQLPRLMLHGFDLTCPAKVSIALQSWPENGFPGDDGLVG
ncbi:MAG: aldolase [Parvibaculum sp.]